MFPTFESQMAAYFWYVILGVAAVIVLFLGYKIGRALGAASQRKLVQQKEEELFQAQRGFKKVYDDELVALREDNAKFKEEVELLKTRVEEYRKKAAGYGGLFNSGGKRADAMYALLLENEALEEALMAQNDKLRQERVDAVKEQLRATSYRRVLMSQLIEEGKLAGNGERLLAGDADGASQNRQLPHHPHDSTHVDAGSRRE